jgi:hypothetical protein
VSVSRVGTVGRLDLPQFGCSRRVGHGDKGDRDTFLGPWPISTNLVAGVEPIFNQERVGQHPVASARRLRGHLGACSWPKSRLVESRE